ncbi:hypothetical protein [Salinarimonas ramus]|uniref:hypothetical protein n=1 Tax=Salinarimonas ramus TaxID=690164 RepID=UPI0016687EC6|nr:hypothetical protein [Salinarimonas ramus]
MSFEQAEGVEPLPTQLQLKQLTQELRALLWAVIVNSTERSATEAMTGYMGTTLVFSAQSAWGRILRDKHVLRDHLPIDEFDSDFHFQMESLKKIFWEGDYVLVFGTLQWILRHASCPPNLARGVDFCLQRARAAYRVIDGRTVAPIASEHERDALLQALTTSHEAGLEGARAHLRNAAGAASEGSYADSVRESISSVESVVRVMAPNKSLANALAELQKTSHVHPAMKSAFEKLYGYASDEQGIRHSLLLDGDSKVDEGDALFMLGACASFVTYLISKGRAAGALKSDA